MNFNIQSHILKDGKSTNVFVVFQDSKRKVKTFDNRKAAVDFIKFLKSGGGFRGEIPDFMFNGKR